MKFWEFFIIKITKEFINKKHVHGEISRIATEPDFKVAKAKWDEQDADWFEMKSENVWEMTPIAYIIQICASH